MSVRIETGNWILDALPDEEFSRLLPGLEPHQLKTLSVLLTPGEPASSMFFPRSGAISFLRGFRDGSHVEVGVIGREGMAGIHGLLGAGPEPLLAVVQHHGEAFRVNRQLLEQEFWQMETLHRLLLRYTYALLGQMSLTAACNQLHSVDQRLAKWLLAMSDRTESLELELSHEFLAHMLGTERPRVTEAIGRIRSRGGLSGGRGLIVIDDIAALQVEACECYEEMKSSNLTSSPIEWPA